VAICFPGGQNSAGIPYMLAFHNPYRPISSHIKPGSCTHM